MALKEINFMRCMRLSVERQKKYEIRWDDKIMLTNYKYTLAEYFLSGFPTVLVFGNFTRV